MKVKKILAAVLALMMIASLAACGKKADDNNNGDNNTDNSLQRVLDAGKLTIGAEGNWIPYVYNDEGTGDLTGFEVEVARSPSVWVLPLSSTSPTAGIPLWLVWTPPATMWLSAV